ncbi:PfkB family carbohydrate kinase [Suttonella ornithocola]|nr:PfkB family carbohydrate kinase [Suttonella ornithocola]
MLGYLGSPSQADILADWLIEVRKDYPHITIQIDPVLGDTGVGLYVDKRLAENYRNRLRKLATGMTPNHFELEYLVGHQLTTLEETVEAAKSLLSKQTQWIIATSAAPETWQEGTMQIAIVTHDNIDIHTHKHHPSSAQGTGDTFAATLAAHLLKGESLKAATQKAADAVVAVLQNTLEADTREIQLIKTLSKNC